MSSLSTVNGVKEVNEFPLWVTILIPILIIILIITTVVIYHFVSKKKRESDAEKNVKQKSLQHLKEK